MNKVRNITIEIECEGVRIDVLHSDIRQYESYVGLCRDGISRITVTDGDLTTEMPVNAFGKSLGYCDFDDADYREYFNWETICRLDDQEEYPEGTPVRTERKPMTGMVRIRIPEDAPFRPERVRLLWKVFRLHDSIQPVYFGMLYDGEDYLIILKMN